MHIVEALIIFFASFVPVSAFWSIVIIAGLPFWAYMLPVILSMLAIGWWLIEEVDNS